MRRREFITILGGSALASPLAVHAQQERPFPVVGSLNSASKEGYAPRIAAVLRGLANAGFDEGRNVRMEFRHANGRYQQLPLLAAEFVRQQVAVIFAGGTGAALAAKSATTVIPIVFSTSSNPVEIGLVSSLSRPGGNLTGTTRLNIEIWPKRLQLLREIVPTATAIALLVNPSNPSISKPMVQDATAEAQKFGIELPVLWASNEQEIDAAFMDISKLGVAALLIPPDAFFNSQVAKLCSTALQQGIAMMAPERAFVDAGGLMSYGGHLDEGFYIAGNYLGLILKGEKPADLPVQQSTRLTFAINLKTAKALGLAIPPLVLSQADEVIE